MALTKIDGLRQIQDQTIKRELLELDFLKGSNLDLTNGNNNATLTGLANGVNNDDAVNKGQMDAAIAAALTGSMTYKGTIDASVAAGTALDGAEVGDFYLVSVAGTLDSIVFNVGDHLVVNAAITDFDVDGAGKIDIIDNTEATDILRDSDIVNDLVTGGATSVLSAQQGVVLKGYVDSIKDAAGLDASYNYIQPSGSNYLDSTTTLAGADLALDTAVGNNASAITALQTNWSERVFGEEYSPVSDSTTYTVASFPIKAGTLRVYINGMRMFAGAGNDYTVVESTGVITFLSTVKGNKDRVVVDYEY